MVSDVDTVWMRDPLEYVERYPEADILTSSDHLSTTVKDDGLEHYGLATSPANIGILFVRKVGLELVNEWNDVLEKDDKASTAPVNPARTWRAPSDVHYLGGIAERTWSDVVRGRMR